MKNMKLQTKNLFQPLTDHLEAMIASGHYPTGTRLPSLRRLCDEFNLSRGTAARGLDYLRDKSATAAPPGATAAGSRYSPSTATPAKATAPTSSSASSAAPVPPGPR